MNDSKSLFGREKSLFQSDLERLENGLSSRVQSSSFLVIGGAGSIGQAIVKEIFKRSPKVLHVIDVSENNLVELVRDLRSSFGYIQGDFQTFALDAMSVEFASFVSQSKSYDYVLNLSALKHVRSEKDQFTLMRMINVNIFLTLQTIQTSIDWDATKYFCVSTDKAANPANVMGATKRIMEMYLMRESKKLDISSARFANVAFSDGSLLYGFKQRLEKGQPIAAPTDVARYFITHQESGELCLMSCLLGKNMDIFFPKSDETFKPLILSDVAIKFLGQNGLEPFHCENEEEARAFLEKGRQKNLWPCLFSTSDTTGEKPEEEFYTDDEVVDSQTFKAVSIIKNNLDCDPYKLEHFEVEIKKMLEKECWTKSELVDLIKDLVPNFSHRELGKHLNLKM